MPQPIVALNGGGKTLKTLPPPLPPPPLCLIACERMLEEESQRQPGFFSPILMSHIFAKTPRNCRKWLPLSN